jgi:glycosyltransferase involved in cell wall biosynthesis
MKILFLSQSLPYPIYADGVTVRVYHLLKEFQKFSSCRLISLCDENADPELVAATHALVPSDIVPYRNSHGLGTTIKKALSARRFYSEEFAKCIRARLQDFAPDCIFFEQTFMAQYAEVCAEIPKVMSAVDAISLAALRQGDMERKFLKKLLWHCVARQRLSFERKFFPCFNRVSVVGQDDADFLQHRINHPISVVPNGVDLEFFSSSTSQPVPKAILFAGNLFAPANREALVWLSEKLFPLLHARFPDYPIIVAGRPPPPEVSLKLPEYVRRMFDLADIREALQLARLFLSPIEYGTGIKNNVLQAMAMGIPVVMTKLVAEPIGARDSQEAVVAPSREEFAAKTFELLESPQKLDDIGTAGRKHLEASFSWEAIALKYKGLLEESILL